MAHTVLARKWRPKKFKDLVGQNNAVTILQNIIAKQRLHHAYLLTGTRGVGKTTIARIIAKALNCLSPENNEPCGTCDNCKEIDIGRFVDVIEIDAASNTGVDNIREVLENSQYAPTSGQYKIYIIDEVHMLSKSAFNAMLKTLEEPPTHVVFILATTDPQKVPITVLSRCLQLKLRNLSAQEIEAHLANILTKEQQLFELNALEKLAIAANGSMRDALSLTDQAIAFSSSSIDLTTVQQMLGISDDSSIFTIFDAIINKNSNLIVNTCQRLSSEGANLESILEQISETLFKISIAQLSTQNTSENIQELASKISLQDCQLYFEISNLGLEQIRKSNQKYPIFTMTLLRMVAFTIGSDKEKEIVIQSNNAKTSIQTNQIDLKPKIIETTEIIIEATPITEKVIIEEKNKVTSAPQQKASDNPPWEESITSDEELVEENATSKDNEDNLPSEDKHFSSWIDFVSELDFSAIPSSIGMVMNNATQHNNIRDNEIQLNINSVYQNSINAETVDFIEKILFSTYQQDFDISFNFVEEQIKDSLKEVQKTKIEQKQIEAVNSINNDEIIQDMLNNFSAKITPNSIQVI
ncbi:MAG: DNA polymerase III subunit gamma/tau [Burkholderiales bacterium]|nr:DNA polymerase III subunit gamma/tau [Burkholderiales bacterium]